MGRNQQNLSAGAAGPSAPFRRYMAGKIDEGKYFREIREETAREVRREVDRARKAASA